MDRPQKPAPARSDQNLSPALAVSADAVFRSSSASPQMPAAAAPSNQMPPSPNRFAAIHVPVGDRQPAQGNPSARPQNETALDLLAAVSVDVAEERQEVAHTSHAVSSSLVIEWMGKHVREHGVITADALRNFADTVEQGNTYPEQSDQPIERPPRIREISGESNWSGVTDGTRSSVRRPRSESAMDEFAADVREDADASLTTKRARARTTSSSSDASMVSSLSRQSGPLTRMQRFATESMPHRAARQAVAISAERLQGMSVGEKLGQGGNGAVYSVTETGPTHSARLAFKESSRPHQLTHEADGSSRVAGLPNAMKTFGVQTIGGKEGLLMEHLQGGDSATFFEKARAALAVGKIEPKQFWHVLKSAASDVLLALDTWNQAGEQHNDVKPENIMVSQDTNTMTLIDFGNVASPGEKVEATTIQYSAPEKVCLASGTLDQKMDVFSAGQVLHSWLTGSHDEWAGALPEGKQGPWDLLFQMARVARAPVAPDAAETLRARIEAHIPEALKQGDQAHDVALGQCIEVLAKMMARDPALRISAAQAAALPFFAEVRGTTTIDKIHQTIRAVELADEAASTISTSE